MGNSNRPLSIAEQIDQFDPLIFPEAQLDTDLLRKRLYIGKGYLIHYERSLF